MRSTLGNKKPALELEAEDEYRSKDSRGKSRGQRLSAVPEAKLDSEDPHLVKVTFIYRHISYVLGDLAF